MRYSNCIYNLCKHSAEQLCNIVNTQIYSYSYESQRTLQLYSSQKIVSLIIHKTPLSQSFENIILQFFTNKNQTCQDVNCDKGNVPEICEDVNIINTFYNFTLECVLENGTKVFCQKNERIDINTCYTPSIQTEFCYVQLSEHTFTLNEMLKKTNELMGDSKYFLFSQKDNNCQVYIKNILTAVNLYTDIIDKFIFQKNDIVKFDTFTNKCVDFLQWFITFKNTFLEKYL